MATPGRTVESFVETLGTKLPLDGAACKRLYCLIEASNPGNVPPFLVALQVLGIAMPPGWVKQ